VHAKADPEALMSDAGMIAKAETLFRLGRIAEPGALTAGVLDMAHGRRVSDPLAEGSVWRQRRSIGTAYPQRRASRTNGIGSIHGWRAGFTRSASLSRAIPLLRHNAGYRSNTNGATAHR